MKNVVLLLFSLLMTIHTAAQTQQGVVKTRGRMVKGVLQPGKGLQGATVQVKDRSAVVSGANGYFSFPLQTNTYSVQSVKKQGYQLVDMEACRNYKYSADPLYLVMETPDQQRSDLLAAERKIRRNLQRQLQEREDEIESLKVSQQEKDSLFRILYQRQGDSEKLIEDMVKRYSTLDYDQLDDFYRKVSWLIENGELTRADSLLRTRGDINAQVQDIIQQGQAIQEQETQLRLAKTVLQANIEEAARRCYSKFEIFKMNHQNDSAAYYIVLRADLDTLDIYFQNDAANFLSEYMARYDDALAIYERMLNVSEKKFGINSSMTAMCNNNIGAFFLSLGHYKSAINYLTKALEIYETLGDDYLKFVGTCESNIGAAYDRQQDYALALQHLCRAKDILTQLSGEDGDELAEVYNSMGLCYYNQRDYQKAEEHYAKAKVIWMRIYGENSYEISISNNNMAGVLTAKGENDEALQLYSKVLDYRKKEFGNRHPVLGITYYNISSVYLSKQELDSAYQYCQRATELWKEAYGEINPIVADGYGNMAEILYNKNDWQGSLKLFRKAYEIALQTRGPDKPSTRDLLTNIDYTMGRMDKTSNNDSLHAEWLSFIRDKVYIANVPQTEASPAYQLGMSGEYVILEYEDWSIDKDYTMLFTNEQLKGKPKTLVFMKDNTIQCNHFENVIGVQFYLKTVGEDKKAGIIDSYRKWKRNGR